MQRYLFLILLLFSVALSSCKDEGPSPDASLMGDSDHKYSYLALGDSYTIGESVPAADRWGGQLAGLLREEGIDVGDPATIARTGWTTSELAKAIKDANPKPDFDLVSLLVGVNNQYRGQSISTFRTEFRDLLQTSIRLAKDDPGNVIVLSIPDWGATPYGQSRDQERISTEIEAFNAVAKDEAQKAGVTFINITPLSREALNDPSYVANDGLHYSGKMHLEWAKLALAQAKKSIQ
ncbi:SGNH/GDSL hydrolase family protein [Pontibacter locisalis]|uniref:SGNH/GDSL hydrolase family protein n=1 Tax=Pontibacter locisalis TaxID=1719035 RepID=A0ABW5ILN6_9BACT